MKRMGTRLLSLFFGSLLLIACSPTATSTPTPVQTVHPAQTSTSEVSEQSQEKTTTVEQNQDVVKKQEEVPSQGQKQDGAVVNRKPIPNEVKSEPEAKPAEQADEQAIEQKPSVPAVSAPASTPPVKEEPVRPAPAQTVTLSVIGNKQLGVILPATTVAIQNGDTVLDVLSRTMKAQKIQMEYTGMRATAYVNGIDNLYEFDEGPKSGWVFKVNGKGGERSAGSIEVQPGDTIEWLYTTDLGKDVGVK